MFTIFIFAALQAVQEPTTIKLNEAPKLRNPQSVITYKDYPTDSLGRRESGIVSTLLDVSRDGKVTACAVTESSGFLTLDRKTCSILKSRAHFDPAKNAVGEPIAGQYRSANSWGVDAQQPRTTIDLPLQVDSVPSAYKTPVKLRIIFNAEGRISVCEVMETSSSNSADRVACGYIKQTITIKPPKSASDDVPAAAVRYLTASLSTQRIDDPTRK